ncbi:MAG TPA: exodeoxyribonuclease VII small subunit [Bacillota bacterium]
MKEAVTAQAPEKSFEEALARLEQIIEELDHGELKLEESLRLFEEGVSLARYCNSKLDEAQGRVELLLGVDGENILTKDFCIDEEE